jgi:hypothetical protein
MSLREQFDDAMFHFGTGHSRSRLATGFGRGLGSGPDRVAAARPAKLPGAPWKKE